MFAFFLRIAFIANIFIHNAAAIPTITQTGAKFFADGQQFFIKGSSLPFHFT